MIALRKEKHKSVSPLLIVLLVLMILYTLSLLLPILWSVITSLKTRSDFVTNVFGLPRKWKFSNYVDVFNHFTVTVANVEIGFFRLIINTLLYSVGCAFLATLTPCITAYAVAKYDFKFGKVIYTIVIVAMILPIVGSLPSEINMMRMLGLYDTLPGIWLMKTYFLGMYFLVFHATFKGVPREFSEAASIDGASHLRVMVRVILPLVKNAFFTVMLIKFIEFWNDYQTPMLYIPSYPTLSYGMYLFEFDTTNAFGSVPMKLAGCMLVLLPIMVLFLVFHNKLIGNVSMGGIKE